MAVFAKLVAHLEWADARVLDSLGACRLPDPKAVEIYAHILGAEHVWISRIAGRQPTFAVWPSLSLDEVVRLAHDNAAELRDLNAGLSDAALQRVVHYRNSAGQEFDSSVEDMMLQTLLHGAYHRGQVALLLRQSGAEPAPTDYIAFVRGVAAATRR